ncbi:MAG: sigma-70 family RNA polymerase sigma factor [Acidobacteria bacterium]|nr:sigma-70 family RNA polymerase sigma factor [Acidobacteriota bacterium]
MEDAQAVASLVRRCVAGDAEAWESFVRQYQRRVYNLCYRFCGSASDAEDLTQDVFIKMYRSLQAYDVQRGSLITWMTTMTRNMLVDHFRRTRQDRLTDSLDASQGAQEDGTTLADKLEDQRRPPDRGVEAREAREQVHQALQKLSPDLREAVILRDIQDMDYREIAQVLKVPEGTVKSRINRGRTELARLLQRIHKRVN